MRLLTLLILAAGTLVSVAEPALIPRPDVITPGLGSFTLKEDSFAHVPMRERDFYLSSLSNAAGFQVRLAPANAPCAIQFLGTDFVPQNLAKPDDEGYLLRTRQNTVIIHAATTAGRFHGLQTLTFWWRHDKPDVLRKALDDGYPVVLCPRIPTCLDFVQHESHQSGRRWKGAYNTLAEAAWTDAERKDYQSFESRLKPHLPRLQARGLGYYDPFTNSPEITE